MEPNRLLIVEDDDVIALHLERTLTMLGYKILGRADEGVQAVKMAEALDPDLILMDIGLNGPMDGIATVEKIRGRWGGPVIYLTSYSDVRTLERAKLTRPYGYILKPFNPQMLRATIEIAIHHYHIEAQVQSISRFPDEDPSPVMRISAEGMVLYANRSSEPFATHWGCEQDFPIPEDWRTYLSVAMVGTKIEVDIPCGERIFACVWSPIPNEKYINLYAFDVTERRRVEAQLQQLNNDLELRVSERTAQMEVALRELEAFSYSVSHDLRAPLRAMNGFSRLLEEDYGPVLNAQGFEYLHRIQDASQRMSQLIDDLLNLSRLTRMEMHLEAVDLSQLARSVMEDLRKTNPVRSVEWVIAEGLQVRGDERLLRVVMENLLGNAWKFTERKALARIEFGCQPKDGQAVYFVRDNGAGFDMAYAAKLFGAFQRLHSPSEFEGSGIGLATVQRIIRRHQGNIWAESRTGEGATFFFTLENPLPLVS